MKHILKTISLILSICLSTQVFSADYKASMFGIKSNGSTLNTMAIQKAIDYISEQGGGQLVFYVGRYLTGSIQLKSNVGIKLMEGAVLVGSTSIYDYMVNGKPQALIWASQQNNIYISGKGIIEGNGIQVIKDQSIQQENGNINQAQSSYPSLLHFTACDTVQIDSVQLWKAAGAVQVYTDCNAIQLDKITVKSKENIKNTGAIFSNCNNIRIQNIYVETSGKSLIDGGNNKNISIENSIDVKGTPLSLSLPQQNAKRFSSPKVSAVRGLISGGKEIYNRNLIKILYLNSRNTLRNPVFIQFVV